MSQMLRLRLKASYSSDLKLLQAFKPCWPVSSFCSLRTECGWYPAWSQLWIEIYHQTSRTGLGMRINQSEQFPLKIQSTSELSIFSFPFSWCLVVVAIWLWLSTPIPPPTSPPHALAQPPQRHRRRPPGSLANAAACCDAMQKRRRSKFPEHLAPHGVEWVEGSWSIHKRGQLFINI